MTLRSPTTSECLLVLEKKMQVLLGEEEGWTLRAPSFDPIVGR
jgi:hypothetical protein